ADALARLLAAVAAEGRAVLDGGTGMSRLAGAAVEPAGHVLVVCAPALGSARRAARLLEAAAARGAGRRSAVVLARGPSRGEIGVRALARALGATVLAELP